MNEIDLSVVVPVYNNAETLDPLLDRLLRTLDATGLSCEIIVVDDGSRDTSRAVLDRRAALDGRIRPHSLARNFGSQAALCAGFDLVRGRRTVCLDADLENRPEDIPLLLSALDRGFDLACGVRQRRRDSWLRRRLPSALLNAYVRHRTGTSVRDIGCGMRAMESRVVRNLGLEGEARRLLTPLLLRRARAIVEVPIEHDPRPQRSGHSAFSLLGIALDFYLLSARRPFLSTGLIAALALAAGVVSLLVGIIAMPRLALPGLALATAGGLGLVLALIGEYAQRIYQLEQGQPFYELRGDEPPAAIPDPQRAAATRSPATTRGDSTPNPGGTSSN